MNDELNYLLSGPAGAALRRDAEASLVEQRRLALAEVRATLDAASEREAALAAELEHLDGEFAGVDAEFAVIANKRADLLRRMEFARQEIDYSRSNAWKREFIALEKLRGHDTAPLRRMREWIDIWAETFPGGHLVRGRTAAGMEGFQLLQSLRQRLDDLRLSAPDPTEAVEAIISTHEPRLQALKDESTRQLHAQDRKREDGPPVVNVLAAANAGTPQPVKKGWW